MGERRNLNLGNRARTCYDRVGMAEYTPPFHVSATAIRMVAEISSLVERYAIRMESPEGLMLRKANRIKTIRSSLAIEGNELSEEEVRTMMEGKVVVAPKQQLQEVRNAIRTYEDSSTWDAYRVEDMLAAHASMMQGLCPEPGQFRKGGVGVFAGEKLIHMAPPAHLVPTLMRQLFAWLQHAEDHLLIRSCVFHYEFEFIHPFSDGNGRIGRLWQSLILSKLNPVFPLLPVENMVYTRQTGYYRAIEESTARGDSSPFIDFMLGEILRSLQQAVAAPVAVPTLSDTERYIATYLRKIPSATARELAEQRGISLRQIEKLLNDMKKKAVLLRVGARRNGVWKVLIPPDNPSAKGKDSV